MPTDPRETLQRRQVERQESLDQEKEEAARRAPVAALSTAWDELAQCTLGTLGLTGSPDDRPRFYQEFASRLIRVAGILKAQGRLADLAKLEGTEIALDHAINLIAGAANETTAGELARLLQETASDSDFIQRVGNLLRRGLREMLLMPRGETKPECVAPTAHAAQDLFARYDPRSRQPQTLGELERWMYAAAASERAVMIPFPVSLNPPPIPGLDRLAAYCRAKYGQKLSLETIARLIGEYVLARGVSTDEAKEAPIQDAADTLAPKPRPPDEHSPRPSATVTTGPEFGETDFDRAVSALDVSLQNYAWKPGENKLIVASMFGALKAKGITLALAQALFRRLIDGEVFVPWSETIPAGYSYEKGVPLPILRVEPETTHCLVTTRERWYTYLADQKRRREEEKMEANQSGALRLHSADPRPNSPMPPRLELQQVGSSAPTSSSSRQLPAPSPSAVPAQGQAKSPVEVFFSYSHKDEKLRDQLEKHLSLLKHQGLIAGWHDRKIGAGNEWEGRIDEHLNSAGIILLLVSADFIHSRYCYDVELKRAMERHETGETRVIPIILKPCDWHGAPFGKLLALPKDGLAVTKWKNRDEAFTDVAGGIRAAIAELTGRP